MHREKPVIIDWHDDAIRDTYTITAVPGYSHLWLINEIMRYTYSDECEQLSHRTYRTADDAHKALLWYSLTELEGYVDPVLKNTMDHINMRNGY